MFLQIGLKKKKKKKFFPKNFLYWGGPPPPPPPPRVMLQLTRRRGRVYRPFKFRNPHTSADFRNSVVVVEGQLSHSR